MTKTTYADKMICPNCHVEMNHHCDKLVYSPASQTAGMDETVGGFLEEFHTCPKRGGVGSGHAGCLTSPVSDE